MSEPSESMNKETRTIAVAVTIPAEANENAVAETIHNALQNDDTIQENALEIGSVDVYQHRTHYNNTTDNNTFQTTPEQSN